MSIVSDERLMAYADGALPPEEAHALEIMISEDPALAARLTPFAMTGAPLAEFFDTITAEPIPNRLVMAITAGAAQAARPSAATASAARARYSKREGFAGWLARALGLDGGGLAFANAFAVAGLVIAGGLGGYTLANRAGDQGQAQLATSFKVGAGGEITAAGDLASALETRASSDAASSDGVVTRSSFAAKDATGGETYCREYRLSGSAAEVFGGVACRAADGSWRVATHTRLKSQSAAKTSYGTASGDVDPAIDAAIGAMITGDILTPDQETALRTKGWK